MVRSTSTKKNRLVLSWGSLSSRSTVSSQRKQSSSLDFSVNWAEGGRWLCKEDGVRW